MIEARRTDKKRRPKPPPRSRVTRLVFVRGGGYLDVVLDRNHALDALGDRGNGDMRFHMITPFGSSRGWGFPFRVGRRRVVRAYWRAHHGLEPTKYQPQPISGTQASP